MNEQRKYSFGEIEQMRNALRWSYPPMQSYYAEERTKEIEERIRTYMAAGTDPAELIKNCMETVAIYQKMNLQVQEEREARAAAPQPILAKPWYKFWQHLSIP